MKTGWNLIQVALLLGLLLQARTNRAQTITTITAGNSFSLFLKSDGSLWAMGYNGYGQLGDGTYSEYGYDNTTIPPEQIVTSNVIAIAAGAFHSLFLKNDNSLWAMGANTDGELGDGTTNQTNLPELIISSGVKAIAAGSGFSVFIESDGSLWFTGFKGWGYGHQYEGPNYLMDPTNYTSTPQQIVSSDVTAVAAGAGQILFLKNDGSLWVMGFNGAGELGDGSYNSTTQPEQIMAGGVIAIAAGVNNSLFIMNDNSLWGMGANTDGELGVNSGTNVFGIIPFAINMPVEIVSSGVKAMTSGGACNIFLKSDGSLWGLGGSEDGELGVGTTGQLNTSPVQIISGGVTDVATSSGEHTLFIRSDGSLWGMGNNSLGELGLGGYNGYNGSISPGSFNQPVQIVASYNKLIWQPLSAGNIQLAFVGHPGANYALDRSFSLSPANWMAQVTNTAIGVGLIMFTNTPDPTNNNFWRVRLIPSP